MSRECKKCGEIILEDDLGCQGCAADRRIAEARREINDRLLHEKQQERREFVARAATNTFCDDSWNTSWDEIVLYSIALWEEYDKQLTELEEKENGK